MMMLLLYRSVRIFQYERINFRLTVLIWVLLKPF